MRLKELQLRGIGPDHFGKSIQKALNQRSALTIETIAAGDARNLALCGSANSKKSINIDLNSGTTPTF